MNSNSDTTITTPMIENGDDGSTSIDEDMAEVDSNQQSRSQLISSGASSTSSNDTTPTITIRTHNGPKRQKEISPCYVCGAKAHGYNFDQITCESCKAFFRRSALKPMEKFRCRNNDNCVITAATRKRCKRCRLAKCFRVGMRKDWILTEEEKVLKREKIVRNRLIKKQAQIVLQHQTNDLTQTNLHTNMETLQISSSSHIEQSRINPFQLTYIYHPTDQQMYERQQCLLEQLSNGYHLITNQYPQPNKFLDKNMIISQTNEIESKLNLIKDLTRELTQMTTLRLLNFFNLIPEFQLLTQIEKQSLLIQNMLTVFMFHGALTYNPENDTFVDRTTADQPYDAKYLLYVYGPKVYNNFVALARELTSVTYQSVNDKQSYEHAHTLFLLLMIVLLFSNNLQINLIDTDQSKFYKIQQNYIDIACRYIHDQFGMTVGKRMFKKLVPLLIGLQKLCSTLANVNLCEMAEDQDRSSQTTHSIQQSIESSSSRSSSTEFNSTMISGRSHLNELQKENREPSSIPLNNNRSTLSVLSNSTTTMTVYNS